MSSRIAELEENNNTLHKLMVSGERRGIKKATEEFKGKIAELEKELEGYKQIAKERAEFIINGEEFGYISLPESQTDRAYLTFMSCKLTDEYAAMKALKEQG